MKPIYRGALASLALPMMAGVAHGEACRRAPVIVESWNLSKPLTLAQAVSRAGHASPEVLGAALEADAAVADADQAGRRQNPALSIETENFAGTGGFQGFDTYETTFAIEQTFRLGAKRSLSRKAALAEAKRAGAQCNVQRLDAQLLAGESFLRLQAAIGLAEIADASADLTDDFVEIVARRVEAGAAAPPELASAKAEAAALKAVADKADGEVEALALALASVWGASLVDFQLPARSENHVWGGISSEDTAASGHPRLTAARAEMASRNAATEQARAGAWPDVTVTAGVRQFEETGDSAFLAGVSLSLPVFDRNRDAARAAHLRAERAELSTKTVEARLQAEQASLVARIRAARQSHERLERDALPFAEDAYASAVEGYRVGKFDLTTTLDARRRLIEIRADLISSQLALETETLRLRALIGAAPFEGVTQ